jgi:hypothetical protein
MTNTSVNIGRISSASLLSEVPSRKTNRTGLEEEKLEFFSENKTKFSFNFNVSTMTKEEIAKRFDKHAPNWYELLNSRSCKRNYFIALSKYALLNYVKVQASTFPNCETSVLGRWAVVILK